MGKGSRNRQLRTQSEGLNPVKLKKKQKKQAPKWLTPLIVWVVVAAILVGVIASAIADIGMLPSYFISESQPLSLIEMLAHNKPCVATAVGEVADMLTWGKYQAGVLLPGTFKPADPAEIAEAVKKITRDAESMRRYQENAQRIFKEFFAMEKCAGAYLKFVK